MRLLHSLQQTVRQPQLMKQVVDSSDGSFQSGSGANTFYRCWATKEPRAVLLLTHGLAEHSGRYGDFASFFADAGIATYALDLPGHGNSDGMRGHVRDFQEYTDALGLLKARKFYRVGVARRVQKRPRISSVRNHAWKRARD